MLLALLFAVTSRITTTHQWEWAASFTSNLAAGFFGSFLTVLLIDRALERERKIQSERIRKLAFAQLRPAIGSHINLLFDWYKAAVPAPPPSQPTKFDRVFGEDYFREVQELDFSKNNSTWPPRSWFSFSGAQFESLTHEITGVIDKYGFFLDPHSLELLEGIANSTVASSFRNLGPADPVALSRGIGGPFRYNVLSEQNFMRELRQHVGKVGTFLALFNSTASEPIDLASLELWRTDVSPAYGSARVSAEDTTLPVGIRLSKGKPPKV